MLHRVARPLLILFVAVAVSIAGCGKKAKEGAPCKGDETTGACNGKAAAIVCIGGTYKAIECEAKPIGCMETVGKISCTRIFKADDPCTGDKQYGCSSDHKQMLECKDNVWKLKMACKSSKGCVENVKGVSCESAEAEVGDACEKDQKGQGSCSPDKASLLLCDGKKFVVAASCRGQNKCRASAGKLLCDTSTAEIDDPCQEDGTMACDVAKKSLLTCKDGKFVKSKECKKRCNNAFDKYSCD